MSTPIFSGDSTPFSPNQIPGLSVWLDSSDTTSFTLSGSTVTALTDKATGTAFTVGGSPTWANNNFAAPNGVNYPGFNTTNGRFIRALSPAFTSFQHTVFIVTDLVTFPGTTGFPCVAFANGTSGSGEFYRVLDYITTPNFRTIAFTSSLFQALTASTLNPFMLSSDYNGNRTINSRIFTGGTATGFGVSGTGNNFTTNAGAIMVGADGFTGQQAVNTWTGIICEVIVYGNRVLSDIEREEIEGYLARKWGLQGSLPLGHQYRYDPIISTAPAELLQPGFTPLSISGAVVWMDAADTSSITFSSGSNISQITNKAPGATAIFATGTPSLTAGTLNGRQSILMGSGNYLAGGASVTGTSISCFAVAMTTAALPKVGSDQRLISLVTATSLDFNTAAAVIGIFNQNGSANIGTFRNSTFVSAIPFSQNVPFIGASIYNGTNGLLYKDGSPGNTTGSTGTFGITKFSLGLQLNAVNNTEYWIGYIGEVLVYNRNLNEFERQTIEGYLALKWGLLNTLPSSQPYRIFLSLPQLQTGVFNPRFSIDGCILWYDGADPASLTGGSSWVDKSASANNGIVGPTGTSMPSRTTWFNGLNCARFSAATTTGMRTTNVLRAGTGVGFVFFIVTRITSLTTPATQQYLLLNNVEGARQIRTASTAFPASINLNFTNATNLTAVQTVAQNTGVIFSYVVPTTGNGFFFVNGTQGATGTVLASSQSQFFFGSANGSAANYYNGDIAEILAYNVTTDTVRQTIEGYLAWKWGLEVNLPAQHPFKNYPPPP